MSYLYLPGRTTDWCKIASQVYATGSGLVTAFVKGRRPDWSEAGFTAGALGSEGQVPFVFLVETDGKPKARVRSSTDTWIFDNYATAAVPFGGDTDGWIKFTFDPVTGDGNFYTSTDTTNDPDAVTWTQLGTTVAGTSGASLKSITSNTYIGSSNQLGSATWKGRLYRAKLLWNATTLYDVDFTTLTDQEKISKTFVEDSVNAATVTINGSLSEVFPRANGGNHLYFPGVVGNYASAPDAAALDIVGDIDLRVQVAHDDWTTASSLESHVGKLVGPGNYGYLLTLFLGGQLRLYWSEDGTTLKNKDSTVIVGAVDGTAKWVRATLDVDNGAAGHDVKFYTSDDGSTWTQLGSTVTTAGTTSIFSGTAPVQIGINNTASNPMLGKMYRAQIYNGIDGTLVFDADFTNLTKAEVEAGSFVEDSTNAATVTLNGSSWAYVAPRTDGLLGHAELLLMASDVYTEGSPKWSDLSGNNHHFQWGSAAGADTNDPLFLPYDGEQYLYLPGTAGNAATRPTGLVAWTTSFSLKCRVRFDTDPLGAADDATVFASYVTAGDESMILRIDNVTGEMDTFLVGSSFGQSSGLDITAGADIWLRVDGVVNGASGSLTYYSSTTDTNDPDSVVWGTALNTIGSLTIAANTFNEVTSIGSWGPSLDNDLWDGRVYRAQLTGDGAVVFDADFTDTNTVTEPYATFTEKSSNAATVTINRSATGVPATVVDRPMFVFDGTDDYMVVSDHADLDFGAAESFTLMVATRPTQVSVTEALVSKQTSVTTQGYGIYNSSTSTNITSRISDGTNVVVEDQTAVQVVQQQSVIVLRRSVVADELQLFYDGASSGATTDTTTGTITNTVNFYLGQTSAATLQLRGQIFAVGLWREALTDAEIASIADTLFGGNTNLLLLGVG